MNDVDKLVSLAKQYLVECDARREDARIDRNDEIADGYSETIYEIASALGLSPDAIEDVLAHPQK